MENKKNKLLILMIVLCIMVPIGGAIAYFRADTSSSNKLSSGNIGIELRDATTNEDGQITDEGINFNFGYPGAIKDKQTFVKIHQKMIYIQELLLPNTGKMKAVIR